MRFIHHSGPNFHQICFSTFPWRVPGNEEASMNFWCSRHFPEKTSITNSIRNYPTRLPVKHFIEVPRKAWSFSRKKTVFNFTRIVSFEEVLLKMLLAYSMKIVIRKFVNLTDFGLSWVFQFQKFSIFTFNQNISNCHLSLNFWFFCNKKRIFFLIFCCNSLNALLFLCIKSNQHEKVLNSCKSGSKKF